MSVFQTADGRWIVGGERSGSEYKGFLGWRDCVIQLTESGATERSIDYLNAFRDYALEHSKLGEPIMPPSVQIWISNNGATSAVQADDMSVDGNDFTICGIKWNGTSWDYSGAGQGSGGGGEGGGSGGEAALIVHRVNQNPNTRKAQEPGGALRADPTGTWLDAKGEDIMAALMAGRGVWLEASVEGSLEYSPLALAAKNPTENEATSLAFIFSIAGTESYFSGLPNEYPVIG